VKENKAMVVFVTAGGTGGHIFPGLALYEELVRRGHEVLFVGSSADRVRFESIERLGNRFVGFRVQQLYRRKIWKNFSGLLLFIRAVRAARALIKSFSPDVCVGMGGFASAPLILACKLKGIPYCIAEQNAIPGRANRFLARWASAVFLNMRQAFDGFKGRIRERCHITGNPVRPGFGAVSQREARQRMGLVPKGFVLGVTGGSQGARAINTAMASFARKHRKITLLWSSGKAGYAEVTEACAGLENVFVHAFVEDMAAFLSASDLVVSRAGATSLSELASCSVPSVLIPYPWAADDHQTRNARAWEAAEAAIVVPEGADFGERLENTINDLVKKPQRLEMMRKAAGRLHDATTLGRMADLVEASGRSRRGSEEG